MDDYKWIIKIGCVSVDNIYKGDMNKFRLCGYRLHNTELSS